MSIKDGPSVQYHRHHHRLSWSVLLNFSSMTIAKGTKRQTLAILQRFSRHFQDFVQVEPNLYVVVIFAKEVQTPSNLCHFIFVIHCLSSKNTGDVVRNMWSGKRERLWCLFTICIQSSFDTVPCSSFSKTTKRHSREIPFLASFATQTHEMVPSYQIVLTITNSLRVRAVV